MVAYDSSSCGARSAAVLSQATLIPGNCTRHWITSVADTSCVPCDNKTNLNRCAHDQKARSHVQAVQSRNSLATVQGWVWSDDCFAIAGCRSAGTP